MFRWIDAIIEHQFAVLAIGVVEEEFLIADSLAVAHMQHQIVTLALILRHHVAGAADAHDAGLGEVNGL